MKKTKLFQLLNSFSAWELRNLKQFLCSPFFNQREDVIKLLEFYIKSQKNDFPNLNRELAFEFVFGNINYHDQHYRLLVSRLLKLTEDFMACREALKDETQWKINLAKAYRKMNMEQPFEKTVNHIRTQLEKGSFRNTNYHHNLYRTEYEYYDFISSQVRSGETNLQEVSNTFDTFYIAGKLEQACLMISHQAVFKIQYEFGLLNDVLNFVENNDEVLRVPAVAVYYHCYKAITVPDNESHFQKLRVLIQEHQSKFAHPEVHGIYLLAINYCIKRLNRGEKKYFREGFELYRSGLESGILLENNMITQFTFNNTVALGLFLKEYNWIERFIENYQNKLNRKYRKNIVNFNLAKLYYEQGNYKKSMRLLVQFDPEDYLLNLAARTLLLKMYYELEEFDSLESLLESMRMYVQRKEVLSYHKQNFENIIRFTKKMMELPDYDKAGREKLRKQILNTKIRSEREWFLKQLELI